MGTNLLTPEERNRVWRSIERIDNAGEAWAEGVREAQLECLAVEQRATIAWLEEERDEALRNFGHVSSVLALGGRLDELQAEEDAARRHLATIKLPTPSTNESAVEFAQRVLREHAETRGGKDWDKLDDELCIACMWSQLILAAGGNTTRLESDIRLLKGEVDMAETIRWLSFQKDDAATLHDFAEKTVIALARLQEERDAARADAARMRGVIQREWVKHRAYCDGCPADTDFLSALTPDDGWLAEKLAEAVKPYASILRRLFVFHPALDARHIVRGMEDDNCGACGYPWPCPYVEARALLSGGTKGEA